MIDIFFGALAGHLLGEFFFQTKTMEIRKKEKGRYGLILCTIHSLIYTFLICLLTWQLAPWFALSIFTTHWVIDRFYLSESWLKLIRGRTFESVYSSAYSYREIDLAFTAPIYLIVDNSMHLFCLWVSIKFLLF